MNRLVSIAAALVGALSLQACGDAGEEFDSGEQTLGKVDQEVSYSVHGFAWANNPTSSSYTPSTSYSYSSSGGSINAARLGTGRYRVTFNGLGGANGNAHVVAYGTDDVRCKVDYWSPSGSAQQVFVRCHNSSGALADSRFVVRYDRPDGGWDGDGAYVWADQATASSYNPSASYSWNSTGGTNRITRTGTGAYNVYLPGLAAGAGTVQVTAYGSGSEHCKVWNWGPSGSEQRVTVTCFNSNGSAADTRFTMNFDAHGEVGVYDQGAYAWANDATSSSYTPHSAYSYDSGTINGWRGCSGWLGTNTAGRYSTGRYFLRHTNMAYSGSSAFVTAYGGGSTYCKVEGWSASGTGVEVRSRCFDSNGSPADSMMVESYETNSYRGPC